MKLDFTGIIKFNKKFIKQRELKDKKKEELDKTNLSLEKLENQLTKLREKEYKISSKLPEEQAFIKLEENHEKQDKKQVEIEKKKEKISVINSTYEKYEKRYLKLVTEKDTAIIDLNLKIAKLEDKIDELRQNWSKAAEKVNENHTKMRRINKDSQEYKELEEENEKHREVMRNSVITSKTGMKLKNELDNLKDMKRILENGEIIEELVKEPKKNEEIKQQESQVTTQKTVEPKSAGSKVIAPKTVEPKSAGSKVIAPKTVEPKSAGSKVIAPKTVEPKSAGSKVIAPKTVEPKSAGPKATTQKIVEPKSARPKATTQKTVEPKTTVKKSYSELTVEELKAKRNELWSKITDNEEYHFRAHKANGMEGYEEDDIDKELKLIREELERREQPKELKWHPKLTEEQIMYAKENDIYEPIGQEYEQFLAQLGITKEVNKTGIEENENSDKKGSLFSRFLNVIKNIKNRIQNIGRKQITAGENKNSEYTKQDTNYKTNNSSFIERVKVDEKEALKTVEKVEKVAEKEEVTR